MSRPETGPMQFPDDWPGVFFRGDNALAFAAALDAVLSRVPNSTAATLEEDLEVEMVEGLLSDLRSCAMVGGKTPEGTQFATLSEKA